MVDSEVVTPPDGPALNVRALSKGDVLSTEFCEKHLGITLDHAHFQLFLNQLGMSVQDIRTDLVVTTRDLQLRVLTDDEAELELLSKARKDVRAQLRTAQLHSRIAPCNLSEDRKSLHETMTSYHGMRVLEAFNAQRKLQQASQTRMLVVERNKK